MKIRIKEKEYDYISDYPSGWNFVTGDHVKFPVEIGPYKCFIKRYERKSLNQIPGWPLLMNLKGKTEPNLPVLHDIAGEVEMGRDIYYAIFEWLDGKTLDKLIEGNLPVNLEILTEDLFKALQSVHKKNYWFVDFCEKNIFCETGGRFLLVDLDNTHPGSELPSIDTIGSNRYWILIYNFYREILLQRNLNPDDINSSSINYLQAVFLLLKLKLSYYEKKEYHSDELFRELPSGLNKASPVFKEIYTKIFRNSKLAIQSRDIEQIKSLVLEMLPGEDLSVAEKNIVPIEKNAAVTDYGQPVIHHFKISDYESEERGIYFVNNGEAFVLKWEVQNASILELHKNGVPYSTCSISQKNIALKEFSDGRKAGIEYKLVATHNNGKSASASLKIQVKDLQAEKPAIRDFAISGYLEKNEDGYTVNNGVNFTLSWEITNASGVELYRNGTPYRALNSSQKNIVLKEFSDGRKAVIEYKLVATDDNAQSASASLLLQVKYLTAAEPVIRDFEIRDYLEKNGDDYVVNNGENFILSWEVSDASIVELHRNGTFYRALNKSQKNILLKEFSDGRKAGIEYKLVAIDDNGHSASALLSLQVNYLSVAEPVIRDFAISDYLEKNGDQYIVNNGENFSLSWEVSNASSMELHKNGAPYRALNGSQKNILLKEFADGGKAAIEYKLVALSDNGKSATALLKIQVKYLVADLILGDVAISGYLEKTGDEYIVNSGQNFTLSWEVTNAAVLELHRDGVAHRILRNSQKNIELKEFFDGRKAGIEYKLVATGENGRLASTLLRIQVKEPAAEPIIRNFIISNYLEKKGDEYLVKSGENFTLSWEVSNANGMELLMNGEAYLTLDNLQKNIVLKEFSGGSESVIDYKLIATGENGQSANASLRVSIKRRTETGQNTKIPEPIINDVKIAETLPEIIAFNADKNNVENLEPYTLSWSTKNVTNLELLRNGGFYKVINPSDNSILLNEVFENKEHKTEYTLAASNNIGEIKSAPVIINLKVKQITPPVNRARYLKIAGAILGMIIIFFVVRWIVFKFSRPDTLVEKIEPQNLYEDSTITIYGEKFSDPKKFEVLFNDSKGEIVSSSANSLVVAIPDLKNKTSTTGNITVTVSANGYNLYSRNFQWFDKYSLAVKEISTVNFYSDSTISVYCNNLNDPGKVKVYFNYIKGTIKYHNKDSLIVSVPENIIADIKLKSVTINVKNGIKTVYIHTFKPKKS